MRKTVKDKWLASKDWLDKMEHRQKSNYNHYNLAKRARDTQEKFNQKTVEVKHKRRE
jgi:hypothetical protein